MKKRNIASPQRLWITLCMLALAACTALPTKEFASYRDAFGRARTAGEAVILDYSVMNESEKAVRLSQKLVSETKDLTAVENGFDPVAAATAADTHVDSIKIRMQAWEVVARYNDALLSLAEGKSAKDVAGSVNSLYQSLVKFPINSIANAAGQVSPFLGSLEAVLTLAEQERNRKEFILAVKQGGASHQKNLLAILA